MSHRRMQQEEARLEAEIVQLLQRLDDVQAAEDADHERTSTAAADSRWSCRIASAAFRRFMLRGRAKVLGEWNLVSAASKTFLRKDAPAPSVCGGDTGPTQFAVTSPTITEGGAIPTTHTCTGTNQSPQLAWVNPPAGTMSFAMLLTDITNGLVHSAFYDIPSALTGARNFDRTKAARSTAAGILPSPSKKCPPDPAPLPPADAATHKAPGSANGTDFATEWVR